MNIQLVTGIAAAVLAMGAPGIAAAQDAHDRPALQLATNGLELRDVESGETDLIGFGTGQDDTVQFLGRALNEPSGSGMSEECGAGPLGTVDFGDLRAYFKAGEFVGWESTSGFHSKQGIHVGMTSDELMAATDEMEGEETSIGYEWNADGFSGLLTEGGPTGTITTIWAGTTCVMR